MKAESAIATGNDWHAILDELRRSLPMLANGGRNELALLFASDAFASEFDAIVREVRGFTGADVLIGCSGQGIIGPEREVEDQPAIALQVMSLPGATLTPLRLTEADLTPDLLDRLTIPDTQAWMFFVDPFSLNAEPLIGAISVATPAAPIIGGLASGDWRRQRTAVFLNDEAFTDGAVGIAIGGAYEVHTVVSQGATPIGETWTITGAHDNVIETIGMRPAFEVLSDTFRGLSPELQERARRNLLVGLAMNEYRDEFRRGDFLIRNLMGVDQNDGTIAVGALPRIGQTIQFQLRDPDAADEELNLLLARARDDLEGVQPVGALLCSCNGRGVGLFGRPDHDAGAIAAKLGNLPLAGFFCNGEIGPVDGKNFLHGFTASIALIVPRPQSSD